MAQDDDGRRADEPKDDGDRRGPPEQRQSDDEQGGVQTALGDDVISHLNRLRRETVDGCEASDEKDHGQQKERTGQQSVYGQHDDDDQVVARKVTGVVRDSLRGLVQVGRSGDSLMVKELGQGPDGRETLLPKTLDGFRHWIKRRKDERILQIVVSEQHTPFIAYSRNLDMAAANDNEAEDVMDNGRGTVDGDG